ncbi:MAG: nucleotidyltransferase family protein [Alphaproteobacteria bacterium]
MTAISHGMILAAGLGLRMRPLTAERPKPLIELRGQTLLDRALERLAQAGVTDTVVNTHYKADMIAGSMAGRAGVAVSHEPSLLDTGGGVRNALSALGGAPFFVVNSDSVWVDGPSPALDRMIAAWNNAKMDALLMVHPAVTARGYHGTGDYFVEPDGPARRRREFEVAPFVFTGVQILHPRLFDTSPDGAFSLNLLYDRAEAEGRLHALVHDGDWYHVGTPPDLATAEAELADGHVAAQSR